MISREKRTASLYPKPATPPTRSFPASNVRRLEERIRELERLLGRKTLEVEILKEAVELRHPEPSRIDPNTARCPVEENSRGF
jgi:hypothetical protein